MLCFLLAVSAALAVVAAQEPATQPATAKLTVTVVDLRNQKGQLIFSVFDAAPGFPSDKSKSKNWQIRRIDADQVVFECDLPPGTYAASVLHDENANHKMDTSAVGIPKEGYGCTNNPKPRFRQATFKESTFALPAEGASLTISVQYF